MHRYVRVALSAVGSAILLFSCSEQKTVTDSSAEETMMTEYSENLSIINSQNGRRSYHFVTPLLEGYTLAREPYREFRKGIKITTYLDDSLSSVDAVLTANYAINYENRELWEAKGNVVVEKSDGKTLYTQQLFWNARTGRIYSNVDSKIVQNNGRDVFIGEGFESDEEFKDWRFRRMKGRMEVEVKPQSDSLGADSTAVRSSSRAGDEPSEKGPAESVKGEMRAKPTPNPSPDMRPLEAGTTASGETLRGGVRVNAGRKTTPAPGGAGSAAGKSEQAARRASKYGATAASGVEAPAPQRNIPTLEGPRVDPLLSAPAAQGPDAARKGSETKN